MNDSSAGRNPLDLLSEEFTERHRRGERPSVEEYIERYPQWAGEIRELFPALLVMEQFKPGANGLTGPFAADRTGTLPAQPQRLGEFLIVRELGHGGMGVVYEAVQESLGRRVAIKVLPGAGLVHVTYLERFRREARAAARLQHPNIVTVHGTFETDGVHYYAMQYIEGQGLDQVLHDLRSLRGTSTQAAPVPSASAAHGLLTGSLAFAPEDRTTVLSSPLPESLVSGNSQTMPAVPPASGGDVYRGTARIGLQVAEALAYAHQEGVLHRDIKPSNLLLDARGTVWVTDFGLAKAEGAEELTGTGDIVGTLRFMAPERFDGESLPQGDLYSLGLTLYELLTLRPAFDDTNKGRLIDKVLHEAPVPPRKLDSRIPRDLETIILKCLAKDPLERYRRAAELAEELRRFLADEPIKARRVTWVERAWRLCRRNPAVALLSLAVFVLLAVLVVQQTGKPSRPPGTGSIANTPLADPGLGSLTGFRGRAGESIYFRVTGQRMGSVWGTDVYTDDSVLSSAVLHAGILREGEQGVVKVTVLPGQGRYIGSMRNGIFSADWGQWAGSYRVEAAGARKSIPAPSPNVIRTPLPPRTRVLPDPGQLSFVEAPVGTALFYDVTGAAAGQVWGTDIYTDDSALAAAAVHAGILKPGERGAVKVIFLPGQNAYEASLRNGVSTSSYNQWNRSYRLEGVKR